MGMSMKRENGRVKIEISEDELALLNYGLGTVGGITLQNKQPGLAHSLIALTNTINQGNEVWVPIALPEKPPAGEVEGFAEPVTA